MTTTEHAELIERLEDRIRELDRRELFGDHLELHELLSECLTALRTSRRNGWLAAVNMLEAEIPKTGGHRIPPPQRPAGGYR